MQKKVLLVRFSALGDLVLTTGPVFYLKKKYPDFEIDLVTSEAGDEVYYNSIDVKKRIIVPKGTGLLKLIKTYRKLGQYDVVIDWQCNFKSFLLKLFLNAEFYYMKKQSRERRQFVKKRKYQDELQSHVVEKYYDVLIRAFSLDKLQLNSLRPRMLRQSITFDTKVFDFSKAVALHPYASQKNKEWPHTKQFIEDLINRRTPVVILGASEAPLELTENPLLLNLTGATTIKEMASIIAACKAFVSTDSGPMHLGIAMQTPTIGLFGPTTKEFGFYPRFKNTTVIEIEDLDCRPCHVHGGNECPKGHHYCMRDITPEMVIERLSLIDQ